MTTEARARLLGILVLVAGCTKVEGAAGPPQRPPAPVVAAVALQRDVPVYLDQIGKCAALEVVSVRPQVSGQVTKIHFTDGKEVKRGQPLFTIDPRPFEAQLQSASAGLLRERAALRQAEAALAQRKSEANQVRANLARDQALQKNARSELSRNEQLARQEVISPNELDRVRTNFLSLSATVEASRAAVETSKASIAAAEAQIESSRAAIRAAEATIATARLQLGYTRIVAPIDGRVGQRLVDVGNVVSAGNPGDNGVMLMIHRLDPIYADFTIPEKDLSVVQSAIAAGAARVEVRLPDDPGPARTGRLSFLDSTVQESTGTVKLRASLANADRRFWPGRFVKVRLVLRTHTGAVLIPATAPQLSSKGTFVYVVKADSTAEPRPVKLGLRHGGLIAVTEGIRAGERVITAGQLAVGPGGPVRVEGAPPSAR